VTPGKGISDNRSKWMNHCAGIGVDDMPKRKSLLPKEKVMVPLPDRLSLSPEQTSALTGIGISRIREAIRAGDLDAHRNGASIVILPDDVRIWLKALPAVETAKDRP
jgi:hypothetical protein